MPKKHGEKGNIRPRSKGSIYDNNGYWYVSVRLPGEKKRHKHPLKAPGAKCAMRSDRPFEMAQEAASRLWEEARRESRHRPDGSSVGEICDSFAAYVREYYSPSGAAECVCAMRYLREVFGDRCMNEMIHTDMLAVRDAMLRNPRLARTTVNRYMSVLCRRLMPWALDQGLIRAATKVELSQVEGLKRGRCKARECPPVMEAKDADIDAAAAAMVPSTADMVRVHRLTGMRPGEICSMRREDIDRGVTPWVYRPAHHKNDWRGEWGQPRAVLIGPKAREILSRRWGDETHGPLFSPAGAFSEWLEAKREARKSPFYPCRDEKFSRAKPDATRRPGDSWRPCEYNHAIQHAIGRAGCGHFTANQLRHAFATEVRRKFGLEACRAVLGHSMGASVTDRYSFAAIEDEMIAKARDAVEALG